MANKSTKKSKQEDFSAFVRSFWRLMAFGFGMLLLTVLLAALGVFGKLPTFAEIENPISHRASTIYSIDGEILGKYYRENRVHVEYEELSPHVVNALVATEDERFFKHSGIDFRSLLRSVASLGKAGGGSTLTQQLAKMLFHERDKNIFKRILQKFKEWVIAVKLERNYTKEEILAMYLNQFDFLYQAVGIHSASRIYFDKLPSELKMEEAAVLVGMAKNSALYNPMRDSTRMFDRRNVVFRQMERNGFISEETYDSLSKLPIVVHFKKESHADGLAPHFREHLRLFLRDWIEKHPKPDGSLYNLYTDGLKIYTTLDARMQEAAEVSVNEHMRNVQRVFEKVEGKRKSFPFHRLNEKDIETVINQGIRRSDRYRSLKAAGATAQEIEEAFNTPHKMTVYHWSGEKDTVMSPRDSIKYYKQFYRAGMMSMDPQNGHIKAWVGGIDFKHFKYDHVKEGRRQVGSTFKPFVYATAIRQMMYSPCLKVPNQVVCIDPDQYTINRWCPENSEANYGDWVTLKEGLAKSLNTITTYLIKQVRPPAVIKLARDLGITAEIPEVYSIALGTVDLSVYEMVGSYSAFANRGTYTEPIVLLRIEDANGIVLEEFANVSREVMTEEEAYAICSLLQGVSQSGTGVRLRSKSGSYSWQHDVVTGFPWGFENPIAGKTGTTQNNSDGWFIGMVPNLITGVWAGCEDRSVHFRGTAYGQGATTALPIWANYMRRLYQQPELGISKGDFPRPEGEMFIELDCAKYEARMGAESDLNPDF